MLNEQVSMFEQLAHLLLLPGGLAGLGSLGLAGSAARLLGNAVAEFLAGCDQGVQHRLGNFLDDVELTDLMGHIGPQLFQRLGIQLPSRRSLTPRTARPRTSSRALKSAKKRRMSFWVGSCSRTRKDRWMKARLSTSESTQNGPSYNSSMAI